MRRVFLLLCAFYRSSSPSSRYSGQLAVRAKSKTDSSPSTAANFFFKDFRSFYTRVHTILFAITADECGGATMMKIIKRPNRI